jgi:3-deoxy-D-manno-octulosonic-acid transferase
MKLLIYIIQFTRFFLSILLRVVLGFTKFYSKRLKFEKRNLTSSFKDKGLVAHIAFEVSSEGELEQVLPIIFHLIKDKKNIELIYASESVEKKCEQLATKYPKHIKVIRLPLLSWPFAGKYELKEFLTAKTLVLCRYDFYPELLLYGMQKDIRFILVNASLKGKKKSFFNKLLYKSIYNKFDKIIWASEKEKENSIEFSISSQSFVFDFRLLQINDRLQKRNALWEKETIQKNLLDLYQSDYKEKIIFASFWPEEAKLFQNKTFVNNISKKVTLAVIAPHHLDNESLKKTQLNLKKHAPNLKQFTLAKDATLVEAKEVIRDLKEEGGVLINLIPAMLCESLKDFDHTFVGGGHGRSIHSVLEPYIAGNQIYCGPKTHRSTEFDFVRNNSPQFIHIVEKLEDFYDSLGTMEGIEKDREMRDDLIIQSQRIFLDFIKSL